MGQDTTTNGTRLADWNRRGVATPDGGRIVGTTRAGVIWVARANRALSLDEAWARMVERFDALECYVGRGLAEGAFEGGPDGRACPCSECRVLRAEAR